MTDERYDISRRKALGALGTIGLASAGAGFGTTAYFSDDEQFTDNTLTAGALDLKLDWEEHYVDWADGDLTSEASVDGVRMVESAGDVNDDEIGVPDPQNPILAVRTDDTDGNGSPQIDDFQNASSIEAYPDDDDDGQQDALADYVACEDLADTPQDLRPNGGKELRTANADTLDENGNPKPLLSLDDVKPGDFGELTLSFHLCDNPGYVWATGQLNSESENGVSEAERDDPDEGTGPGDADSDSELTDEIQTLLWYDEDGDNVYEPGGSGNEVDVTLVLDRSGSMSGSRITEAKEAAKELVNALNLGSNAAQVGVVSFSDQESLVHQLSTDASSVNSAIDGISAGGSTNIEGGVNGGEEELTGADLSAEVTASGNARSGADKVMVVLSDGAPNVDDDGDGDDSPVDEATRAKNNGVEIYTIGFGISPGSTTAQTLEAIASDPDSSHAYLGGTGTLTSIFGQISQQIAGEEAFFRGSLRELLDELSSGRGIPLDGDRSTPFDELTDPGDADGRDCFVDATTNAIGLAWWLPVDHGNEVQGDSVNFDLGFYTEQCRHNDGAGMATASGDNS